MYNIYNRIIPSCLEHLTQWKESQCDLRHQHRVSAQRFATYYMKNSISYRGSIAWNLFEPSAVSTRDYAKRAKSLTPSETWTLMKSHRKWAVPKLTVISYFIDPIHIFYCTNYFAFCWPHSYFSVIYILTLVYFFIIVFSVFLIFIILLTFFTQPHKLY